MAERLRLGGRQAPSGGRKGKRTSCAFFASPPTAAASTSSAAAPLRLRLSPLGQQGGRPVIFTNGREWLAEGPGLLPGRTMCVMAPESHTHSHAPPPPPPPLHSDVCAAPHLFSTSRAQHTLALHYGGALSQRSAGRPGMTRWERWQGKPGQVRARASQVGQGRADGIAAAAAAVASHGRATEERGHEGRRRQPDRHGQRLS